MVLQPALTLRQGLGRAVYPGEPKPGFDFPVLLGGCRRPEHGAAPVVPGSPIVVLVQVENGSQASLVHLRRQSRRGRSVNHRIGGDMRLGWPRQGQRGHVRGPGQYGCLADAVYPGLYAQLVIIEHAADTQGMGLRGYAQIIEVRINQLGERMGSDSIDRDLSEQRSLTS